MCRATQCERKLHVIHLYGIVYVYAISSTLTDHKFCASQSRTHFVWITNRLCSHIMNSAAFSEFNVAISMFFFLFRFFHSHRCVCVFVRVVFFQYSHNFVYASVCTDHLRNSKQEKYVVLERRTITSLSASFVLFFHITFCALLSGPVSVPRIYAEC